MRVLVLTNQYPYPLHNGQNLRIYHYVRLLSNRIVFDLACYESGELPKEIKALFDKTILFKKPIIENRDSFWARLMESFSVQKMIPWSVEVRNFLSSLNKEEYDLIWLSGWDMAPCIPKDIGIPVLSDIVDDGVLEYWREINECRSITKKIILFKRLLMNYRFERHYFCGARRILLVSEVDAGIIRRICRSTEISVIHNGVDADYYRPVNISENDNELIFEGSMNFRPNVDGIIYFCKEIYPRILEKRPESKLYIVGRDPSDEVKSLASDHTCVTGFVDDVRPFISRAAIFICPLRKGAGIKNKILQAWSMRKAVVATTISTGGLDARHGYNICIEDDPRKFAAAVVDLLEDKQKRKEMGERARSTILNSYTWEKKSEELAKLMSAMKR